MQTGNRDTWKFHSIDENGVKFYTNENKGSCVGNWRAYGSTYKSLKAAKKDVAEKVQGNPAFHAIYIAKIQK